MSLKSLMKHANAVYLVTVLLQWYNISIMIPSQKPSQHSNRETPCRGIRHLMYRTSLHVWSCIHPRPRMYVLRVAKTSQTGRSLLRRRSRIFKSSVWVWWRKRWYTGWCRRFWWNQDDDLWLRGHGVNNLEDLGERGLCWLVNIWLNRPKVGLFRLTSCNVVWRLVALRYRQWIWQQGLPRG